MLLPLSTMHIFRSEGVESLYESVIKIVRPVTPKKIYKAIVEEAVLLIGAKYGSIFISSGKELKRVYSTVPSPYQVIPRLSGYTQRAYRKKKIYILNEEEIKRIHPEISRGGTKSLIILPLSYRNKSWGVLTLRSEKILYFNRKKVDILKLFAYIASIKIRNSFLKEETKRQLKFRKEFSAFASHELKTPLTVISLYTDLIERKIKKGGDIKPVTFKIIQAQIDRMANIIDDFLLAKKTDPERLVYHWEVCNIYLLLKQVVSNYIMVSPKRKINLETDGESKKYGVWGDKHKLQEVFINLINNAIKFSPQNSLININAELGERKVTIYFKDQGIGIKKKDMPYLFHPFYKRKGVAKVGSGMGLYLSKNIIESHNGTIKLNSKFRKGTTAIVEFPLITNKGKYKLSSGDNSNN